MEKNNESPKILWGIGSKFCGNWGDLLSHEFTSTPINRVIIGFHGYGERAETQVRRFDKIKFSERDLWLCPQALHGFLIKNREFRDMDEVDKWGWSWMNSSQRSEHIIQNKTHTANLKSALADLGLENTQIILVGHSQGASHAWRVASWWPVSLLILHAGDIPPELRKQWPTTLRNSGVQILLARSQQDPIYTQELFKRDCRIIEGMKAHFQIWESTGSHQWSHSWSSYLSTFLSLHFLK